MRIVIADASCLITLDNIDETDLLPKLYEEIIVTPEVASEVGPSLPEWVEQRSSSNHALINQLASKRGNRRSNVDRSCTRGGKVLPYHR